MKYDPFFSGALWVEMDGGTGHGGKGGNYENRRPNKGKVAEVRCRG